MFLTRLILHEQTHVILRKTLNDFNLSSPKIFEPTRNEAALVSCAKPNMIEAGNMSEKELFGGKIDCTGTATSTNFNNEYCSDFLSKLMKNQRTEFNIKSSGVVLNKSKQLIMAVDCDNGLKPIFE